MQASAPSRLLLLLLACLFVVTFDIEQQISRLCVNGVRCHGRDARIVAVIPNLGRVVRLCAAGSVLQAILACILVTVVLRGAWQWLLALLAHWLLVRTGWWLLLLAVLIRLLLLAFCCCILLSPRCFRRQIARECSVMSPLHRLAVVHDNGTKIVKHARASSGARCSRSGRRLRSRREVGRRQVQSSIEFHMSHALVYQWSGIASSSSSSVMMTAPSMLLLLFESFEVEYEDARQGMRIQRVHVQGTSGAG